MFDTVLVANRGEIARRVIRACRELGIHTVAVYSDADAEAPFVDDADQAVRIGPAAAAESYLDQEAILAAADRTGADAIHPGYGFLSENDAFASAVQQAGFTWVGPDPDAMTLLGDKVQARALAIENDVPVSPGSEDALASVDEAKEIADEVGYPVMLKAAAGGGGMGMRVVREPDGMAEAFESAKAQAESAFGDGSLFLERYIERPRHVEVQVLGGPDGDVIHLYERECSIQRRHQKLVEEAPSPALSAKERESIGRMAVRLAEAGGYTNAGTLEFLYSPEPDGSGSRGTRGSRDQDGEFFFNEMNTRLQVEHPVTEMVTGVDLVQAQLRVAAGHALDVTQDAVEIDGHAIEVRVNAEDPYEGFLPRFGTVSHHEPPTGEGIRVETGVREGWTVPADYDSLLAKVIAWGPDRRRAARRLASAVANYRIGCTTNLPLHRRILNDDAFLEGDLHTGYLEERGLVEALEAEGEAREDASRTRAAALTAALTMAPRGGIGMIHHRQTRPARLDQDTAEDDEGGDR